MPVIGFLSNNSSGSGPSADIVRAVRQGFAESGLVLRKQLRRGLCNFGPTAD
jgi:hypothetical protein